MSTSIATKFYEQSLSRFAAGEVMTLTDITEIVELHNLQYAVAGARIGGIVFDPVFSTTSTTYTKTNSTSGGRNLDTWWGGGVLNRSMQSSGEKGYVITVSARLAYLTLGFDLYQGETLLGTLELSNTGNWASASASIFIGGESPVPVFIVPKGGKMTSGTGRCAMFHIWEGKLTTSQLPNGVPAGWYFDGPSFIDHAWEADFGVGVSDGAAVDLWRPVKGGWNLSKGTNAPVYSASGATTGSPSVLFDSTTTIKTMSGAPSAAIPAGYTVIAAMDLFSTGNSQVLLYTNTSPFRMMAEDADGAWNLRLKSSTDHALLAGGWTFGPARMIAWAHTNASTNTLRVDATSGTGSTSFDRTLNVLTIGRDSSLEKLNAYVHGVYIAESALSAGQLDELRTYLQGKGFAA